jgi:hypothetical protein
MVVAERRVDDVGTEYDYYVPGHALFLKFTPEDKTTARQIWQEGLERFPDLALLRNKLAWTDLEAGEILGPSANCRKKIEVAWP